ncbi:hypothetical protein GAMM_230010 [Gammaproteobacteria bacterium]
MFHQSCETLPYGSFIQIIVSENPVFLTIKGHPSDDELRDAWEDIKAEYSSLIKTNKSESIFDLWKKINVAQLKIDMLFGEMGAFNFLKYKGYDEEIAKIVESWGLPLILQNDDREAYIKSIMAVEMEAKFFYVQLNQYHTEYKLMCPEQGNLAARTIQDYDKDLAVVQKYMGFRIDKTKITTAVYCSYYNLFIEEQDALKML